MATSRASAVTNCSICGEPLNAKGDCVACLLRRGLGGSIAENGPSASLVFGDFEVPRREDGSFWELGRGAFGVTYLAVDNVLRRRVALKVIDVPAAQGLVHRDLKPANIMLTSGNAETAELEVKVIDFGLAKAIADAGGEMDLTHGEFVGTPTFASPEQFGSGAVDVRSDIYSLGATLWFAITGKTPF